jgi:hypothetical protein
LIPMKRSRPNRREYLTFWQKRTSRKRPKNGGDGGTGVYMREGTTSRVITADRPFGEFYDFCSVSPEYFGYTLVLGKTRMANSVRSRIRVWLISVTVFMYIDEQLLVPRRIKWRRSGACGWNERAGGCGVRMYCFVGACQ